MAGDTLTYDLRGNTLTDGVYTYTYDILNHQTGVTGPGGAVEYIYDARGRRVAKVTGGVTVTHYIYDTQYRVLEERNGDSDLLARYTYGAGMDEPLTMERDGETYYYHRDALGSITEVTDESGTLVERYEYDVYGAVTIFDGGGITLTTSAIGNPYLFTARRYDPESGNYYYRARVYSPSLGRFLSMDPLGLKAGDYNLYRYALNNPTNMVDPTGEVAWFIPWLLKASAEAAVDALMQATVNYFLDPNITTVSQAISSIDLRQMGVAFVTGLLPGGRWVQSLAGAAGDVIIYILDAQAQCREPDLEEMLRIFGRNFVIEVAGSYLGDLAAKYGTIAVAKGLRELGFDEIAEKLLRNVDDLGDGFDFNLCSFSEDTLVTTEEGLRAINDLKVGDYVLTYDEATGEIGYYSIAGVWIHEDLVIVDLTVDGELIETTLEHPFYMENGEWVTAGKLQVGDQVRRADGSYGTR